MAEVPTPGPVTVIAMRITLHDNAKIVAHRPHWHLFALRRIVDRNVLWLIKLWLKTPVEERDGKGNRRMSGGKNSKHGTPQGGVLSPLLSVIYMNRFLILLSQRLGDN